MATAYHAIRETRNRLNRPVDLRTASFINAIDKIAGNYRSMGIWP
jgi:glutamate dehydrogenase (NAD(P)+)